MSKANFICALDLETIANPAMLSLLPEVKPSGTLKDPDKIKKDIESRMGKQISGMGLNPHTNTICCASFQDVYTGESVTFGIDTLDGEKELLVKVWDYVNDFQMFTTFNGISFDIECLKFHSMLYKIKPSVVISQQKYKTGNHVDLRMVLSRNNEFAKGTQDYFCKLAPYA